MMLSVVFRKLF